MPDPKLKSAMEEIKTVLAKYDIAGIVLLASETHLEFLKELSPKWSCVYLEPKPDGYQVGVRALRKEFPSVEAQRKCLEDSIGMLLGFEHMLGKENEVIRMLIGLLADKMRIENMLKEEPPENPPAHN